MSKELLREKKVRQETVVSIKKRNEYLETENRNLRIKIKQQDTKILKLRRHIEDMDKCYNSMLPSQKDNAKLKAKGSRIGKDDG